MTLEVRTQGYHPNGKPMPLVVNTHSDVDVKHLRRTLGKKRFSELSVTGKTVLKAEGLTTITFELKGE